MLSGLANDDSADAMTDMDLQVTGVMLLIAGHETTVNLITNGTLTLLRNPDALARLRREPGWVVPVAEELLRFEPPLQYLPNRAALADIIIDGTTISKGSQLTLLIAAANRDPGRFADPDRFDPDRPDNQHLGFGSGLHYCFGAPLARVEVQPGAHRAGQPTRQPQTDRRPATLPAQPRAARPAPPASGLRRAPDPLATPGQPRRAPSPHQNPEPARGHMAGRRRPGDQRCTRGSSLPAGRAAGRYALTGPEEWSQVSKPGQCRRRAVLAGGLLVLCQHRAGRLARASAALPPAKWTARLGNTARSLCTASTLEMIPPGSAPNGGSVSVLPDPPPSHSVTPAIDVARCRPSA